jgi:hypothetical protein
VFLSGTVNLPVGPGSQADISHYTFEEGVMRVRVSALACGLAALGSFAAPSLASAAPRHDNQLTIAAVPDPVIAGEGVLIYGRLFGPSDVGQTIRLYHHVVGSGRPYTFVTSTTTGALGYYEFNRPEGLIYTNRSWFVRGPAGAHSRTVNEQVIPLVGMDASTTSTDTSHPIVFTGHVTPNHAFERVFLQQQNQSSDDWTTLRSTFLSAGSNYAFAYRWTRPGVHDVRVVFKGDARNLRGASSPMTVNVEQAQMPGFTIFSSSPIVRSGGAVTITGKLDQPETGNPEPNTLVQLWGRTPDQRFAVLGDATTGSDGSYSFTQAGLTNNVVYYVATMPLPHTKRQHTARLYEGVQDLVTLQAGISTAGTAQMVTFFGTVLPDKTGHLVYLQKLGQDGDWHTIALGIVGRGSTIQFTWTVGSPGTYSFRARVPSDQNNVGAASAPVIVTATAPAASTLPPAS